MKNPTRRALAAMLACLGVGGVGGWLVSRALADGVPPTPGSIYYSGEITNVSGTPFTATSAHVQIRLFDREAATGATMYCSVDAPSTPVTNGHFRVALDPTGYTGCLDALHAHATTWIEVQVETETLPREQIGAVPYALEAERHVAFDPTHARGATVGGTFCGVTPATSAQFHAAPSLTGYPAARALCQTACGASPTAHMCTGAELAISAQLGAVPATASGWYAPSAYVQVTVPGSVPIVGDCEGWTTGTFVDASGNSHLGAVWDFRSGVSWDHCDHPNAIACCD